MNDTERRRRVAWRLLLGSVALLGFGLRTYNIDWDEGQHLHPDERHWSFVLDAIESPDSMLTYFDSDESPLSPYAAGDSFVYGTLPLFATKATSSVLGTQPLRPVVSVLDALGVDLVGADGSLRFDAGYNANLIGRLLSATVDTATIVLVGLITRRLAGRRAALFAATSYALTVLAIQQAHFLGADPWATMFTTGAALATLRWLDVRRSRWLVVAGLLVGGAISCRLTAGASALIIIGALWTQRRQLNRSDAAAIAGAFLALLVMFRVTNPYAFDGWGPNAMWLDDLALLRETATATTFPPSLQWIGRSSSYPFTQLIIWGVGPGISILALAGAITLARRRPLPAAVTVLAWWPIGWILFALWYEVNTLRYLLPITPLLCIAAGIGLATLVGTAFTPTSRLTYSPRLMHWTSRLALGALVLLTVGWAAAFTSGVYGHTNSRIDASRWIEDNVEARASLTSDVWDDALPLRLSGVTERTTIQLEPFVPDSREKVLRLVDQLDDADVIAVTSQRARSSVARLPATYPATMRYFAALADGTLGFVPVASFQNLPRLGPFVIDTIGAEEAFSVYDHPPVTLYRKTDAWSATKALATLDPWSAEEAVTVPLGAAAANNALLTPSEVDARNDSTFDELFHRSGLVALALWSLWMLVVGVAAVPFAHQRFASLAAAVPAAAIVGGPATVGISCWVLVANGITTFSAGSVLVLTAVLLVAGAFRWRRDGPKIAEHVRSHRAAWVSTAAVAMGVFLAVVAVRSLNPDLWFVPTGGEKPMEFAYFNATARTSHLPVADPWYSGGALNYYYVGWFLLAVPTRLLSIDTGVAFQLGLATSAAAVAVMGFACAHDIVARVGPCTARPRRGSMVAGAITVALLTVAGNLDAARQGLNWVADGTRSIDWWRPSRVHRNTFDITEFPAWSTLFGDLHPHVMSWWIGPAVVLLCLSLWTGRAGDETARPDATRFTTAAMIGVLIGLALMVNTWDVPALAAIACCCLLVSTPPPRRRRWRSVVRHRGLELLTLVVVAQVLTAPYRSRSVVVADGIGRSPITTALADHLIHVGPFLALFALWAIPSAATQLDAGRNRWIALACVVGTAVAVGVAVSPAFAVSMVVVGTVAVTAWTQRMRGEVIVVCLLAAVGLGLLIVGDVLVVNPDIGRMNTVFKFGLQGWVLLAVASGPAVVWVTRRTGGLRRSLRLGVGIVAVPVGLAMALFPVLTIPGRVDARFAALAPTLDGLAYLRAEPVVGETALADDLPLIEWMRANVAGDSTIVELGGSAYGWNGRVSVNTGLPTVIGWTFHQTQQRQATASHVDARTSGVYDFYQSRDPIEAARFVATHRVEYVVIGTLERAITDSVGVAAIELIPGATTVFTSGAGRIVHIDLDATRAALAVVERGSVTSDDGEPPN